MPKGVYTRKPKSTKFEVGTIHNTPQGPVKILEHLKDTSGGKHHRVVILCMETGYVANVQCTNITTGKFKDYRKRTVYGIGYLGTNIHIPSRDSGLLLRRIYDLWANMLKRAYAGYDKSYSDVSVDQRWHSFEVFLNTISDVPGYTEWERGANLVLDKDTRVPGNRMYSRDTCHFISPYKNSQDASTRRWASRNA